MKLHRHTTGPWTGTVNVRRTLLSMEPGAAWTLTGKAGEPGAQTVREACSRLASATGRSFSVRTVCDGGRARKSILVTRKG